MTLKPPSLSRERRGMDQKLATVDQPYIYDTYDFLCVVEIGLQVFY
jgi:hypothetical protein